MRLYVNRESAISEIWAMEKRAGCERIKGGCAGRVADGAMDGSGRAETVGNDDMPGCTGNGHQVGILILLSYNSRDWGRRSE